MKTLVVFLLAALGCRLAEGKQMTKCELRDELKKVITTPPAKPVGITVDDFVAQIVCRADQVSGLKTDLVTELRGGDARQSGQKDGHARPGRGAGPDLHDHDKGGHNKGATTPSQAPTSTPTTTPGKSCSLYGIFQLSSCKACSDGSNPSANICNISCNNLLDDNISDDIECLKTSSTLDDNDAAGKPAEKQGGKKQPSDQKCGTSGYFADCPSS